MNFSIDLFHCTELGESVLTGTKLEEELSNDERLVLALVYKYQYESEQQHDTSFIEKRFKQIYSKVNLTRLVVLKLLHFDGELVEDEIEEASTPSSSGTSAEAVTTKSASTKQSVLDNEEEELSSILEFDESDDKVAVKPVNAINQKPETKDNKASNHTANDLDNNKAPDKEQGLDEILNEVKIATEIEDAEVKDTEIKEIMPESTSIKSKEEIESKEKIESIIAENDLIPALIVASGQFDNNR